MANMSRKSTVLSKVRTVVHELQVERDHAASSPSLRRSLIRFAAEAKRRQRSDGPRFVDFIDNLKSHRKELRGRELARFDKQWPSLGDLTLEDITALVVDFALDKDEKVTLGNQHPTSPTAPPSTRWSRELRNLVDEYKAVQASADEWITKLRTEPPQSAGVQLLDLFVVDLIGRGSAKSKVFMNQSKSFRENRVATVGLKGLLSAVIVIVNLYFIFSCMLYAKDKGKQWRKGWIFASIVNIVLHFMTQTNNAVAIYYMIPNAISSATSMCKLSLNQCILKLAGQQQSMSSVHTFSATDFYFVSTRVAKAFPDLLESAIVLSHQSPTLPTEQSSRWTGNTLMAKSNQALVASVSFGVSLFLTYSLVFVGSQSIMIQRFILSGINPIIYSGVSLFCLKVLREPTYGILLFTAIALLLAFMLGQRIRNINFSFKNDDKKALRSELFDKGESHGMNINVLDFDSDEDNENVEKDGKVEKCGNDENGGVDDKDGKDAEVNHNGRHLDRDNANAAEVNCPAAEAMLPRRSKWVCDIDGDEMNDGPSIAPSTLVQGDVNQRPPLGALASQVDLACADDGAIVNVDIDVAFDVEGKSSEGDARGVNLMPSPYLSSDMYNRMMAYARNFDHLGDPDLACLEVLADDRFHEGEMADVSGEVDSADRSVISSMAIPSPQSDTSVMDIGDVGSALESRHQSSESSHQGMPHVNNIDDLSVISSDRDWDDVLEDIAFPSQHCSHRSMDEAASGASSGSRSSEFTWDGLIDANEVGQMD